MGFKENLKDELRYQGVLVKELAAKSSVPKGTFDHYRAEKLSRMNQKQLKLSSALMSTIEKEG